MCLKLNPPVHICITTAAKLEVIIVVLVVWDHDRRMEFRLRRELCGKQKIKHRGIPPRNRGRRVRRKARRGVKRSRSREQILYLLPWATFLLRVRAMPCDGSRWSCLPTSSTQGEAQWLVTRILNVAARQRPVSHEHQREDLLLRRSQQPK